MKPEIPFMQFKKIVKPEDMLEFIEELPQKQKESIESILRDRYGCEGIDKLTVDFAVEFWRFRRKANMLALTDNKDIDLVRKSINRIEDIFKRHEIEITDWDGKKYDNGYSVNVLMFEESEDLKADEELISETIKPQIRYRGKIIEHGQVIVKTPLKKKED
jgi:hypothetical protein